MKGNSFAHRGHPGYPLSGGHGLPRYVTGVTRGRCPPVEGRKGTVDTLVLWGGACIVATVLGILVYVAVRGGGDDRTR
jgi:hypothetical protein